MSLNRTFNPKYTTYTGDGFGRDGYIVFGNGGLHELRQYNGSVKNDFNNSPQRAGYIKPTACKESTAFDYTPDGSGRDSYVIKCSGGLKREYKTGYVNFQGTLREKLETPHQDAKINKMI